MRNTLTTESTEEIIVLVDEVLKVLDDVFKYLHKPYTAGTQLSKAIFKLKEARAKLGMVNNMATIQSLLETKEYDLNRRCQLALRALKEDGCTCGQDICLVDGGVMYSEEFNKWMQMYSLSCNICIDKHSLAVSIAYFVDPPKEVQT